MPETALIGQSIAVVVNVVACFRSRCFCVHPSQLPALHVSVPLQVPWPFVIEQARWSSSTLPSQLSSMLLHVSATGVFALHPTQLPALHVSVPVQVPWTFVTEHVCDRSSSTLRRSCHRCYCMFPQQGFCVHPTQLPALQLSYTQVPKLLLTVHPRQVLVGQAVAVIIDIVAVFRCRGLCVAFHPHCPRYRSRCQCRCRSGSLLSMLVTFLVGFAVAVIVDVLQISAAGSLPSIFASCPRCMSRFHYRCRIRS